MVRYDPHVWRSTFFAVRGSMLQVIGLRSLYVTLVATVFTTHWMAVVGVIFMVFVLYFPRGIWGTLIHRWQARRMQSGEAP